MDRATKKIKSQVKNKELVEIRRREIVKAAVDLFVKKGFHKTTVREIARRFGMSIGTIYEYIRTKEDILYLVCDYIHSSVSERVKPFLTFDENARDALRRAINIYFSIVDEMQDYILFLYQETKSLDREARKYIFRAEEHMTEIFEKILYRGIEDGSFSISSDDVKLMAHNIMVLGQMWAFRRWVLQKHYKIDRYIDIQTRFILKQLDSKLGV
ncbi:MAG: TetR family transcriptional regulator [Deltaproteobacteria bacterium]|jgi:AcrR family transcriptional regulator|nr:MAG: TetR family transcriptional regulator [Deltaproteobacteria bacterium]